MFSNSINEIALMFINGIDEHNGKVNKWKSDFIRWALASPLEVGFLRGKVQEINKILEGDEGDSLRGFIFAEVSQGENAEMRLRGTLKNTPADSLFGHYQRFCESYGYEEPSERNFGEKIVSLLQSMGVAAKGKRTSVGMFVKGVKRDPTSPIKAPSYGINLEVDLAEIRRQDPFTMIDLLDERSQPVSTQPTITEAEESTQPTITKAEESTETKESRETDDIIPF